MRNETASVAVGDAGLLVDGDDVLDGRFWRGCSGEVGCGHRREFSEESGGLVGDFCKYCFRQFVSNPVVRILKRRRRSVYLTFLKVARVHHPRADGDEENPILLIFGAVLGHDRVDGRLRDGVRSALVKAYLRRHLDVAHAGRDGDDLLHLALEDERQEHVEQVDVADDVCFERCGELLLEGDGIVGAPVCAMSCQPLNGENQSSKHQNRVSRQGVLALLHCGRILQEREMKRQYSLF